MAAPNPGQRRTGRNAHPDQVSAMRMLLPAIRFYKLCISPLLPPACRFEPTCSQYAAEAVSRYGALKGGWLALKRILRCHPLCRGGFDPVPEHGAPATPKTSSPGK
jgi:putative membrane protein insertion efficiency factor